MYMQQTISSAAFENVLAPSAYIEKEPKVNSFKSLFTGWNTIREFVKEFAVRIKIHPIASETAEQVKY